jgi:CBS-domain-containing membrane protein
MSESVVVQKEKKNRIIRYFRKFKGFKREAPFVSPVPIDIIVTFIGSFLALAFLGLLAFIYQKPMLVAPFGATAVLVYGAPDGPLSQPRNVILGHTFSALIGVLTYQLFGLTWWSVALGTSLAIMVMLLTKTTHPPGGATALFAILSGAGPMYILTPILFGAVIMVIIALFVNNLSPNRNYPRYWF